jgi:hypothetical protein
MLITDDNITFDTPASREENVVDEHILHMRKLLKTSLEDLDLSVRAYNCLKAAKINTLAELVRYDTHELLKFRNFGKKSLVEIEELLQDKGLTFGMDLANTNWTKSKFNGVNVGNTPTLTPLTPLPTFFHKCSNRRAENGCKDWRLIILLSF